MLKLKRQTLQSRLKATEMLHSLKKVYSYLSVLPSLMALSMVSKKRVKDSYTYLHILLLLFKIFRFTVKTYHLQPFSIV